MTTTHFYLPKTSDNDNVWTAESFLFNSNLVPTVPGLFSVGTVSEPVAALFAEQVTSAGALTLQGTSIVIDGALTLDGNILPALTNTYTVGSASFRYATVFCTSLNTNSITSSSDTVTLNPTNIALAPSGGTLTTTATLRPTLDNSIDVGMTTNRYNTVYCLRVSAFGSILNLLGTSIDAHASLSPITDNILTLGTSLKQWSNMFTTTLTTNSISSTTSTVTINPLNIALAPSGGSLTTTATLRPTEDNTIDLGLTIFRFNTVYCTSVNAMSSILNLLGSSINVGGSFAPDVDNTRSLGTSLKRWADIKTVQITCDTITTATGDLSINPGANIVPAKSIFPLNDNTLDMGSVAKQFKTLWIYEIKSSTNLQITTSSDLLIQNISGDIRFSAPTFSSVRPQGDTIIELGNSTSRWQTVWTPSVNCGSTGDLTLASSNSIVTTNTFRPNGDYTLNFGSSSFHWNTVFAQTLSTSSGSGATISATAGPITLTSTTSNLNLNAAAANIVCNTTVRPTADNTHSLGTSALTWLNAWARNVGTTVGNLLLQSVSTGLIRLNTTALRLNTYVTRFQVPTGASGFIGWSGGMGVTLSTITNLTTGSANTFPFVTLGNVDYNSVDSTSFKLPLVGIFLISYQVSVTTPGSDSNGEHRWRIKVADTTGSPKIWHENRAQAMWSEMGGSFTIINATANQTYNIEIGNDTTVTITTVTLKLLNATLLYEQA